MSHGFLPRTDQELLAFAKSFSALINASPSTYHLSDEQCVQFAALLDSYAGALQLCDPGVRNQVSVTAKNEARSRLRVGAKRLANIINGYEDVSDAQKVELGLSVPGVRSKTPMPPSAPNIQIVSVVGHRVTARLRQAGEDLGLRGRPKHATGAILFTYVAKQPGEAPPAEIGEWRFENVVGKTNVEINFPSSIAGGTTVYLAAMWGLAIASNSAAPAPRLRRTSKAAAWRSARRFAWRRDF